MISSLPLYFLIAASGMEAFAQPVPKNNLPSDFYIRPGVVNQVKYPHVICTAARHPGLCPQNNANKNPAKPAPTSFPASWGTWGTPPAGSKLKDGMFTPPPKRGLGWNSYGHEKEEKDRNKLYKEDERKQKSDGDRCLSRFDMLCRIQKARQKTIAGTRAKYRSKQIGRRSETPGTPSAGSKLSVRSPVDILQAQTDWLYKHEGCDWSFDRHACEENHKKSEEKKKKAAKSKPKRSSTPSRRPSLPGQRLSITIPLRTADHDVKPVETTGSSSSGTYTHTSTSGHVSPPAEDSERKSPVSPLSPAKNVPSIRVTDPKGHESEGRERSGSGLTQHSAGLEGELERKGDVDHKYLAPREAEE